MSYLYITPTDQVHGTSASLKDHVDVAAGVSDSDAQGDILIRDATNWTRLAAGTNGYYLQTQGAAADPVWAAAGGHGTTANLKDHTDVNADVSDSDAHGDLFIRGASDWTKLAYGAANWILQTNGANLDPSWVAQSTINAGQVDGKDASDFVWRDGTHPLTANWDAGGYEIRALTLESDVATGTAPLTIASTTVVANLNVDQVDGKDETAFVLVDGSRALTAAWDAGGYEIRSLTFESDVTTGTAPFTIASTTVCTNLNADMLDGKHITTLELATILIVIDGGGSAVTTGQKAGVTVDFACTINQYTVYADQSTTSTVDLWKTTYAAYDQSTHPVDADSITASAPVAISAAVKNQDSTLTGWTTAVAAGDYIAPNVDASDNATWIVIAIKVTKT